MKKRLILLAGLGVGYVLGSRTGRQSYEKLKAQAQDLWTDPRVQDTVEKANQSIREKSPAVADAVQTAADKVNSAAGAIRPVRTSFSYVLLRGSGRSHRSRRRLHRRHEPARGRQCHDRGR